MKSKRPRWATNSPPEGRPWIWLTRDMLASPAWRILPHSAKLVVDRIVIEHMDHAGTMNGRLKVTYDNFASYGVRRKSVSEALRAARALGFIVVISRGFRSHGPARRPAEYALTWLPLWDGAPASNRWAKFKTLEEAQAALELARRSAEPRDPPRSRRATVPSLRDIDSRGENAPGEILKSEISNEKHGGKNAPGFRAKTPPEKNSSPSEHQLKETALAPGSSGGNGAANRVPQRDALVARAKTSMAD